jgi:RNA polymerase sigma-70 factor (ECF subfamily)
MPVLATLAAVTSDTTPFEGDLLARARRGEVAAFERLYRRYVGRIHGLCLRLTGDRSLAEDLTQTAFLRAWQRLDTLRDDGGFGAWLHRLATNTVYQDRRSWQRKWGRLEGEERFDEDGRGEPQRAEPLDLERAVAALPRGARDVLLLHDVEGYRHQEIADLTGTSVGTTKSQLHRARRLLREALSS